MNNPGQQNRTAFSLANFRVLVVDDFPFMADLMTSMIREFGVGNIVVANNGKEAKEMIMMFNGDPAAKFPLDLVIADWLMPDGDGADLIKWIRDSKKDSIRFLPIILCSAYASEEVLFVARDGGANEALVKPVSAEKMAGRIQHIINHPRPFIKAPDFFGPDRRRKIEKYKGEDKRVKKAEEIKENHEQL